MEDKRVPVAGQLYLNKDKKLLQFILMAADIENQKDIAVYQELEGDYKVYAKGLDGFLLEMIPYIPETPHKAQQVTKEYIEPYADTQVEEIVSQIDAQEIDEVNPILIDFLDADTYEEKLNIIIGSRKNLTDKVINHMAISIDCIVENGDIEERIESLIYCLKTHARFEGKRLR